MLQSFIKIVFNLSNIEKFKDCEILFILLPDISKEIMLDNCTLLKRLLNDDSLKVLLLIAKVVNFVKFLNIFSFAIV